MIYDPAEHALVIKALTSGLSNCVEWVNSKTKRRVDTDPGLQGRTARFIVHELIAFVAAGGRIDQVQETRSEYSHRRYYYKAVLPVTGFLHGVFVEMELQEPADPDVPGVILLNAHAQDR